MVRKVVPILFLLIASLFAQQDKPDGKWLGTLDINGVKLRIVFNITTQPDGKIVTLLDSPDQGAEGIPTDRTTYEKGMLNISMKALGAEFTGKMNTESGAIEGMFSQGGMILPLNVSRVETVEKPKRPQTPQPPFPYAAEEVKFKNEKANIELAGTLTIPQGSGPFPAVILVSGSGPQDRDESLMNHKPFLILADFLSRNGIAVLRYDDRGVAKSGGDFASATTYDFADDAESALLYLKSRKEIDGSKTGMIGHSEGGQIAAILGARSKSLNFLVALAGPGIVSEEIIYIQAELIDKASGRDEKEIEYEQKITRTIFKILKETPDSALTKEKMTAAFNEFVSGLPPEIQKKEEYSEQSIARQIDRINNKWFRNFLTYNAADDFAKTKIPSLCLLGEKDLQVPPAGNKEGLEAAFKKAGNKNYEIKVIPGVNHLFQTAKTGSPSEYAQIEETMSPIVLQTVLDWIKKTTK